MEYTAKNLSISAISVSTRIRKDTGEIGDLAGDIKERGLINPITVMDCGNGKYQLIAGLRRLEACKRLKLKAIHATILSPMDAEAQLQMEYAENMQRRDFTVVEQLEYADKIKAVEKAKARERQALFAGGRSPDLPLKGENPDKKLLVIKRSPVETGKSRELISKKAGFSSPAQYTRAEKVASLCPELLDKIDSGETTIYGAYKQAIQAVKASSATEVPPDVEKPRSDQIIRAGHDRLMKNPLYAELWAKWKKAVADVNTAVTELEFRSSGYENRIRNYQDNVAALSRRCEELEQEIAALRGTGGNT